MLIVNPIAIGFYCYLMDLVTNVLNVLAPTCATILTTVLCLLTSRTSLPTASIGWRMDAASQAFVFVLSLINHIVRQAHGAILKA